jgi:hypothetical protein
MTSVKNHIVEIGQTDWLAFAGTLILLSYAIGIWQLLAVVRL